MAGAGDCECDEPVIAEISVKIRAYDTGDVEVEIECIDGRWIIYYYDSLDMAIRALRRTVEFCNTNDDQRE